MAIEDFLLTRSEIQVVRKTGMLIPIHRGLVKGEYDPEIPYVSLVRAVKGWYEDLTEYESNSTDTKEREWLKEVFLREEPVVTKEGEDRALILPRQWNARWWLKEGYQVAHHFQIGNAGGPSLTISEGEEAVYPPFVSFTAEKFARYARRGEEQPKSVETRVYDTHNVDSYPQALLLRNWAIEMINEAMRRIGEEGLKQRED